MGVRALRVVQPGPLATVSERARPFACNAAELWEQMQSFDTLTKAVADCDFVLGTTRRRRHGRLPQWTPAQARAAQTRRPGRWAVVFGSEADGLTADELAPCDAALALDLPGTYPSLNLSHAVLLILWSLSGVDVAGGASHNAERPRLPEATGRERRALSDIVLQALSATDYFARTQVDRVGIKIERIVQSARLSSADSRLCAGIFRHFERHANAARD